MIKVDSVHAGTTARIRVITHNTSNEIVNADSVPSITIYSGEPEFDTEVVAATEMTADTLGTYDYWWDTTGLDTDTYLAVVPTTVDSKVNNNRLQVRVLASTV